MEDEELNDLDKFKRAIVEEIRKAFEKGINHDDIIGTLESAKLLAFKTTQSMQQNKNESLIGYR